MGPVRYNVAASLDGYIAGPEGEVDWIPTGPSADFAALFAHVDTVLLGRRSFELVRQGGAHPGRRARACTCSRVRSARSASVRRRGTSP